MAVLRKRLSEKDRDARDLMALRLLDRGMRQDDVCRRCGMTRGPLVKLLRDIREDMAENGEGGGR